MTITNKRSQLAIVSKATAATPVEPIPMPGTLPPAMAKEWDELIRLLSAQNLWAPEKAGILESYFVNLHVLRMAKRQMDADGGPLLDGKVHPASQLIARHAQTQAKCAALLGLGKLDLATASDPEPDAAGAKWKA